jgi:hypothetical protein
MDLWQGHDQQIPSTHFAQKQQRGHPAKLSG